MVRRKILSRSELEELAWTEFNDNGIDQIIECEREEWRGDFFTLMEEWENYEE